MDTFLQKFVFVFGVFVLAVACRSFGITALHKVGSLLLLVASYMLAYFLFDSHAAGVAAVLVWFFLPWVELLTRVRQMRLPMEKKLSRRSPPRHEQFPELHEVTDEVEEAGFEHVADTGWDWGELRQFFRIFYNPATKTQAALCLNEQHGISLAYIAISSRDVDGNIWRSWTFPFSEPMQPAPDVTLNRIPEMGSVEEMVELHGRFLSEHGVTVEDLAEDDPEAIEDLMEGEVRDQIEHNLSRGIIVAATDEGTFRYSWRGLFFLWTQILKDMVKFS